MLELTRRGAFGLAATAALSGVGLAGSTPTGGPLPIPGRSAYLRGLGHPFRAVGDGGRFGLRLVDVTDLAGARGADPELSFNLIFCPTSPGAAPGIYRLGAAKVPEADLFLSPVSRSDAELQVLVNRSVRL